MGFKFYLLAAAFPCAYLPVVISIIFPAVRIIVSRSRRVAVSAYAAYLALGADFLFSHVGVRSHISAGIFINKHNGKAAYCLGDCHITASVSESDLCNISLAVLYLVKRL